LVVQLLHTTICRLPSRVRLVSVTHNLPARVQIHIHRATANSTIHSNSNILPILTDSRRSLLSHHLCILNPPIHLKGTLQTIVYPISIASAPTDTSATASAISSAFIWRLVSTTLSTLSGEVISKCSIRYGSRSSACRRFPRPPTSRRLHDLVLLQHKRIKAQVYRNNPAGQQSGPEWSRRPTGSPQTGEFARAANGNTISGRRATLGLNLDGEMGG